MSITTITIVLLIIGGLIVASHTGGLLPSHFGKRTCQGRGWRNAFPNVPNKEIRSFLIFFTDAFAFNKSEILKLKPDDQLLDIYQALYPHKWQADSLEFETLADDIETEYGVSFEPIWKEGLTLGELFAYINRSVSNET